MFVSADHRPVATIIAFLDAFGSRTIRHKPLAAFRALRERLPDMEPRDIAIAADLAKGGRERSAITKSASGWWEDTFSRMAAGSVPCS